MGAVGWGKVGINHQTDYPFHTPVETHSGAQHIAAGSPDSLISLDDGRVADVIAPPFINFGFQRVEGVAALAASSVWPEGTISFLTALTTNGAVVDLTYDAIVPDRLRTGVVAITYQGGNLLAAMEDGQILCDKCGNNGTPRTVLQIPGGVRALAGGSSHVLALRNDGTVYAWSYDSHGLPEGFEVPADARSEIVAIAAGGGVITGDHFLALRNDGRVVAFGGNDFGESTVPAKAQEGVTAIAAGWNHSVALKSDGTVVCWGDNSSGQCDAPAWVQGSVRSISAGAHNTLALVANSPPVITAPPADKALELGRSNLLSVSFTGTFPAFQWLRDGVPIEGATNATYPLMLASAGLYAVSITNGWGSITSSPPAFVKMLPPVPGTVVAWNFTEHDTQEMLAVPLEAQGGVVAAAGGYRFSLALKDDGSVLSWGDADNPVTAVPAAAKHNVVGIAAGGSFAMALKFDGGVIAWGDDTYGQTDVPAAAQSKIRCIAAGGGHCLAVTEEGSLVAWGYGSPQSTAPEAAREDIVAVAAGSGHSLVLKSDGSVIAWGDNNFHQTEVPVGARFGVVAIAAYGDQSFALKPDGSVVHWGNTWPPPTEGQGGAVAIAVGADQLTLKSDGTVVLWNWLGDLLPVPNPIQGQVMAIAAGYSCSMAILGSIPLRVAQTTEGLIVSWPNSQLGFHLESASSLGPAAHWTAVSQPVRVFGSYASVSLLATGTAQIFRIR